MTCHRCGCKLIILFRDTNWILFFCPVCRLLYPFAILLCVAVAWVIITWKG